MNRAQAASSAVVLPASSKRATVAAHEAPEIFARADPGPSPGGEADFIVSANCLSQLGLVPGHSLPAYGKDRGLPERCAKAAPRRHLAWLGERPGLRLLLADAARLDLALRGAIIARS